MDYNNDFYEFENRAYVNPTTSRDEQLTFADNLRDSMNNESNRIATQTYNLGTAIPSSQGGLSGSNSYFTQRYQTTPVESQVNTLKATAQSQALNDLMNNYKTRMANRYNQAYRRASTGATSSRDEKGGLEKIATEDFVETNIPPKQEDYYLSGDEQTKVVSERSGLPEFLVNILKIFGGGF